MKRIIILDSCHKYPNRIGSRGLDICGLNGNYLLSVPGFPSWCPLKTVEDFYTKLKTEEENSN